MKINAICDTYKETRKYKMMWYLKKLLKKYHIIKKPVYNLLMTYKTKGVINVKTN